MRVALVGFLLIIAGLPGSALGQAGDPSRVVVGNRPGVGQGFVKIPSGASFFVWGLNYDHDEKGRLIEDYWQTEWPKVERDFSAMKRLGANVVRVHLQFGRFVPKPNQVDPAQLDQLGRLLELAERVGLLLDLTGLGSYHKADIPPWYDALDEAGRWRAQATFWEAVAARCRTSPAVFCYDLMNEPLVSGDKQEAGDWLGKGPGFGGKFFVQKITLDPLGRPRGEVARQWLRTLRDAVRRGDPNRLITVGLVDWSLDEPGKLFSGITPDLVAEELDFVAVHLYPRRGKVDEDLATLAKFGRSGKPVIVEETFLLACDAADLDRFVAEGRKTASGFVGFYWGHDRDELRREKTIPAALIGAWLDFFERVAATPAP